MILFFLLISSLHATVSPRPQDVMPSQFEFTIPHTLGNARGEIRGLEFGSLVFDSGQNVLEETILGEVRRWVFQASGGKMVVGNISYPLTCIRASRMNTLTPTQEFYYELRVSAQEGSCTVKTADRKIEVIFNMEDFVAKKFRTGVLQYFGQTSELLLYRTLLRMPDRPEVLLGEGTYQLSGKLKEVPPVANLQVEILMRPKGQMSCKETVIDNSKIPVDWERDVFSSVVVSPTEHGKWGASVPRLGGALCVRIKGGGWESGVVAATLPNAK